MSNETALVHVEHVERRILAVRGQKVLLDSDLVALYGVTTKALNQAVKRNPQRFPEDLMLQVTREEYASLAEANRSQFVTGSQPEDWLAPPKDGMGFRPKQS